MKIVRLFFIALVFVALNAAVTQAAPTGRERINFDAGWRFHRGDLNSDPGKAITLWRWKPVPENSTSDLSNPPPEADTTADKWDEAKPGDDTFHGRKGFAWYRAILPDFPGPKRVLHFDSVDDFGTVWLNNQKLVKHGGWSEPFDVPLESAWKTGRPNIVTVLVENNNGPGGIGTASVQHEFEITPDSPPAIHYNDSNWRKVHLPHDFVVEGTFTPTAIASHGSLPTDTGWYRKTFDIPAADKGKSLWIDFDGIYRDSRVWLNGELLGRHKSGYIGVRYDITDKVNYGSQNVLVVRCDARAQEGWWYEGGGIYRHVWLTKANAVHIVPDSLFVKTEVPDRNNVACTANLQIVNDTNAIQRVRVAVIVLDNDGHDFLLPNMPRASTALVLKPHENITFPWQFGFADPHLWELDHPYLYRCVAQIYPDEKGINDVRSLPRLDAVTVPFGVRTIRFDPEKGFFLNGKPVKIKGVCNHQDFIGVGTAMPDSLLEWRIKKLKEMGCNAYRMSHNPPAPELLDACDRLGMLVMDENRHLGDTYSDHTSSGTEFADLTDLKDLIRRDRNHPSIIMWSMCNEEGLQGSEEGAKIFAGMKTAVLALDDTRPVTCAMNGGWGEGISNVEDLQGCNYNPDGYDDFHRKFPKQPMYGSETASETGTRGEYLRDNAKGYTSAYNLHTPGWMQTAERTWRPIAEREFMAGAFVWTGFDYKGEPSPFGWPCINSHFGIMDMCGFPKDAYYYYLAWWGDKPVVHVFPHWNWPGREGKPTNVWVHSNAAEVELFLNGASQGKKTMPRNGHLEWTVAYTPGKLEAKGYDAAGRVIATDTVETTDAPAQIRLLPDRNTLKADSEDVIMVEVDLHDAKGRLAPLTDNDVTFTVTGAGTIAGVGNGDPSDHDPDKASHRKAFHGKCMVLVQAADKTGSIELTASAPGLKSAKITLQAKK